MNGGMYTGSVLDDINSKPSALERSEKMMSQGMATMNKTQPNIPMPEKTVAGGLMGGLGGAGAGAMAGSALASASAGAASGSVLPGWGTAIGAGIGMAAYYMS